LRDGGRIIDCAFADRDILRILNKLADAGIDIVELGFLRDKKLVKYNGNSTFFTDVDQLLPFIEKKTAGTMFVAFADFGMFDFETLKPCDGRTLDGIRVGFTKSDFCDKRKALMQSFHSVKEKGYKLFIQGVNSLGYSDRELLEIIETANDVNPVGFGIVDTYGAMYIDDVIGLYNLIDRNLHDKIAIDFHSHNNFQLSFSFAQEIIRLSNGVRKIVIDATLSGMGKGAGNLNTELIVDYLVRKLAYHYDLDLVLDIIDEHLYELQQEHKWGYSAVSMMSGIYKSHPNNVIYLTQNFRLRTKDVKNILSMLGEKERQRYEYGKLEEICETYNNDKYDDGAEIALLRSAFKNRAVLVLAPGNTLNTHRTEIDQYIAQKDPVIVSVNFSSAYKTGFCFFANRKRYPPAFGAASGQKYIVTSDIAEKNENEIVINYHSLVNRAFKLFNNSALMLLNLLKRIGTDDIAIAGLDGFSENSPNYFDKAYNVNRLASQYDEINAEIAKMLKDYVKTVSGRCNVSFVTPGMFESVLRQTQ
jgi:4-hydroxy 2-oxovalerate aldolase